MSKYKVLALSVGALSNKIFNSGDIVDGSAFPEGHAEHLVKEGFLKPYELEEAAGNPPTTKGQKPETPVFPDDRVEGLAGKAKSGKTTPKK